MNDKQKEIDAEIALHLATVDRLVMVARDMPKNDLRCEIIRELLDLARRVLESWQLDRENR